MNDQPRNHITINGKLLSGNELEKYSHQIDQEVFSFLIEWFSDRDSVVVMTSGSTGEPKQITLKKQAMVNSALMTGHYLGFRAGMTALLCLSPTYIAGKMMIVRAIVWEMNLLTVAVESNPLISINQPIDFCAMVPLQLDTVLEQTPDKLHLISKLIIGGSATTPQLEAKLSSVSTQCFHTYGMTETLSHIALRPLNGPKKSDWFQPLPKVQITLDERQCLCVDAEMLGVKNLFTNDIARINKAGAFQVLGRIDDVLISAGMKVHPEKVEQKVLQLLGRRSIMSAAPDPKAGLHLILVIEGMASTAEIYQIWEQLSANLSKEVMPRRLHFVDSLPMLESGKIDRKGAFALFQD